MDQLEELSEIIEKLRLRLHETSHGKCFTDPAVIKVSKELNKILNEYEQLVKQKCK
ncbi:MAG: Sporulation stage 0, Spo0E-like regulatory phosphatase [Sporomusa sp.]|nr:Sporulation stage 0, Spo0E-like regulatory phosphatase [Sporomusa sp.]